MLTGGVHVFFALNNKRLRPLNVCHSLSLKPLRGSWESDVRIQFSWKPALQRSKCGEEASARGEAWACVFWAELWRSALNGDIMWAGEQCRPVGSARPKRLLPTRRLRPLSVRAQQLSPRVAHSWDEFWEARRRERRRRPASSGVPTWTRLG